MSGDRSVDDAGLPPAEIILHVTVLSIRMAVETLAQ